VRLLLDSNACFWMATEPDRLSAKAREAILESAEEVCVSLASIWELGIKRASGRLPLPQGFAQSLAEAGITILDITLRHVEAAVELPLLHGDPFDRMIVAQTRVEDLILVTSDGKLADYGVPVIPATA
jgi:PIN domain nuclease of toxin-antitoxin system